jgi:hypothetical protein
MNSPTHQWVFFFSILASPPCLSFPVPHQGKTPIFPKITLFQNFNENLICYKLKGKDSRATGICQRNLAHILLVISPVDLSHRQSLMHLRHHR